MEADDIKSSLSNPNATMNELHELIRNQASYSELVAWVQKHSGCSYREACIKVNGEMQQYRLKAFSSPA